MTQERESQDVLSWLEEDKPKLRKPLKDSPGIDALLPLYHDQMGSNPTYKIVDLYKIDGHEIAWMEYTGHVEYDITKSGNEGKKFVGRELKCECDFTKGVGWKIKNGQRYGMDIDGTVCGPSKKLLEQRHEQLRNEYTQRFSQTDKPNLIDHFGEIVDDLIKKRKDGEFLEGSTGAEFWGGYFYTETLKTVTGTTWEEFWQGFRPLLKERKIMLNGAVVQEYTPPPPPTYEEYTRIEMDGYTVTAYLPAHERMNQTWAIELTGPDGTRLEPGLGPHLSHTPLFGPDVEDVEEIKKALEEVLKSAKTALPTEKPKILINPPRE